MRGAEQIGVREALQRVRAEIAAGRRFVGAYYDTPGDTREICYVVADRDDLTIVAGKIDEEPIPALSSELPAADWAEREMRDFYGVRFDGIPESRSLLPDANPWANRRGAGSELSTILYGPVRSGIVESARWIIETAGEDFIAVYPSMFFKHRGLERLFTQVDVARATFVAEHVSGATAASHATCLARAAEAALGVKVSRAANATRAALIELERIHQHLDALAKLADDGSLAVGSAQTFAAKELVHRLLAEATGNRFARGAVCVGGVFDGVAQALQVVCTRTLDGLEHEVRSVVAGLFATQSLLDRLINTGHLNADVVREHGAVGPVARGSGVSTDARMSADYLFSINEGDEVLVVDGDAAARARVRAEEIKRSFFIIRQALSVEGATVRACVEPSGRNGTGIARVESPQGELVYMVRIVDGALARVWIRSASFANWPLFVHALPGNIFTDFSFIEHSFGLIQAETDR